MNAIALSAAIVAGFFGWVSGLCYVLRWTDPERLADFFGVISLYALATALIAWGAHILVERTKP